MFVIRKKSYHARVDRVYGFTKMVRWTNVLKLQGKVLDEINVVLNLVSFYYLAGYYSEEETLDKPLEIYRPAE